MKTSHTPALLKIVSCAALLLMGASLTFVSCSKSKVTPKSTNLPANAEQPFQAAVNNASLVNGKLAYGQGGGAEIGYRVHFSVGGTIIQLGANMATNGTYTVSFWRTSDTLLMARASVTVTDTSKFAYTNIAAINVILDTSYTVSIHIANGVTQSHWVYTWTPARDEDPFTEGNVVADQVLDQAYLPVNAPPSYPYAVYSSDQQYVGSSCDFTYVPGK